MGVLCTNELLFRTKRGMLRDDLSFCGKFCADLLFQFLADKTFEAWNKQQANQNIPQWYVDEMQGIFMGAQLKAEEAGRKSSVTMLDLILPNYFAEEAMGLTLSGEFLPRLLKWLEERHLSQNLLQLRDEHVAGLWRLIAPMCDGYAVKDGALLSGKGVLVARSLQAGGTLWAEGVSFILRKPVCDCGPCSVSYRGYTSDLLPTLSVGTLGQVGALTVMNSKGFGTGTQTLRSSAVDVDEIGIGSALLSRYTADVGGSTQDALAAAARAVRGIPYIHIMGDAGGDIEVAEMVRSEQTKRLGSPYDYLKLNSEKQEKLLRDGIHTCKLSNTFPPNGVFARRPDYSDPECLPSADQYLFNEQWSRKVPWLPITPEAITAPDGMIWSQFGYEWRSGQFLVGSYFFPPVRRWPDGSRNANKIVSTNYSINPEISLSCMTPLVWLSGIDSEAGQWRYDTINRRLYEEYGKITVESWKGDAEAGTGMQYISPWAVPGYPLNHKETKLLPRSEYGKMHISGSLAIMDLTNLTLHAKFGYWGDGWTSVNLRDWLKEGKGR